ncbi:MAG: peptidoglycan -binding protein [Burkholderiales bacterium]|nr:peptidoglycan -binding protein [Burkholderiales bacterium]
MLSLARRSRHGINVWPAFVDALASILLVFIFVLLIFVFGYLVLGDTLAGRNRALAELQAQVNSLAETLALERRQSTELRAQQTELETRLAATLAERDQLEQAASAAAARAEAGERDAADLRARLEASTAATAAAEARLAERERSLAAVQGERDALRERRAEAEQRISDLGVIVESRERELSATRQRESSLTARVEKLNSEVAALREQLARLAATLEAAEMKAKAKDVEIADLGRRLNLALALKADELQRYRSEFFGRLREILGDHPSIRIVGDRFVFQSELLFPSASATLTPDGERQLARLAQTLKSVTDRIPPDIRWILRVDGHTDRRPIRTERFRSNWSLATARALSVVEFLIAQGIAPDRLAAAGFGEFHPLDQGSSPEALARNRRIEIKLTQP